MTVSLNTCVPARVGGVDLSSCVLSVEGTAKSPRPCGRGGFKRLKQEMTQIDVGPRPCGRGGFKHRKSCEIFPLLCPRPCGRGGFKHNNVSRVVRVYQSPPVWAGWI